MRKNYVLKGNICYCIESSRIEISDGAYLVCEDGKSAGIFPSLPEQYQDFPITDFGECLIIPGLVDLHTHAPQYAFRGLGMDMPLMEWLETHTFPEESKYGDMEYAKKAYQIFADNMKKGATTRACIFATIHSEGTDCLMNLMEETGLHTMVGRVNMDRNSPANLCEPSPEQAQADTEEWIIKSRMQYRNTEPILTPRFIPTCSDMLMEDLGELQQKYHMPVQSHLSENDSEIAFVQELCPWSRFYGDAYDRFGLFGGADCRTVMAHCVHSGDDEIALMKKNGVFIAHCAQSNTNLMSGAAPVRRYLEEGIPMGLGSDVAGGCTTDMFRAMVDSIHASNLRYRLFDDSLKPLTPAEAFYLATKGGGAFFGRVGSFEPGYEMDALVLDDRNLLHPQELTTLERLERMIYLADERNIVHKYVAGEKLF